MQSTLPPNNQPKRSKGFGTLIVGVVLIAISATIWLNYQYIADSISFWRYQPTSEVETIATKAELTDAGKFTFYAAQPSVDGNRTFNATCDQKETNTAILGCYVNNRIYIFNVTDARLDGIKEVTAAHEMLHAVYQRLSDDERSQVNRLVEDEFNKLRNDPSLAERMAFYARTEPGERDNELHSIIGTEIASISADLETHYKKYFKNRNQIVALHDKYNSVFTQLAQQEQQLGAQLDKLYEQIQIERDTYKSDVAAFNADVEDFKRRAEDGDFTSVSQYNTALQALRKRSDVIDAARIAINADIDRYETLREQYNEAATLRQDLYKSIDSSLAPAPKV